MSVLNKINVFLVEAQKEKEYPAVQSVVDDLNRALIKVKKEKSHYAYNERNLTKDRYSEYTFIDSDRATQKYNDIIKIFNKHGYKNLLTHSTSVTRSVSLQKSADERVEIFFDKNNKFVDVPEFIMFHYARQNSYAWEK